MAVTVAQIREGIAASLAALDGVQVSPYMLANPTLPYVQVVNGPTEYDLAMQRGLDKRTFMVQAFVGYSTDIGSQVKLDGYLAPSGSQSIKALVEADRSLGGIVQDVNVVGDSGLRQIQKENQIVVWAEWRVEVLAAGK